MNEDDGRNPAAPSRKRAFASAGMLAAGGMLLLAICSPWPLGKDYLRILREDADVAVYSLQEEEKDWLAAAYFFGRIGSMVSPAILGMTLVGLAAFGSRAGAEPVVARIHTLLIVILSVTEWIMLWVNETPRYSGPLRVGAAVLLGFYAAAFSLRHMARRKKLSNRPVILLTLFLYAAIGAGGTAALWNNTQFDIRGPMVCLASGAGLGFLGLLLRLKHAPKIT